MKKTFKLLTLLLVLCLGFSLVSCKDKDEEENQGGSENNQNQQELPEASDKWPADQLAKSITTPPSVTKSFTFKEESKELIIGFSENVKKSEYQTYTNALKSNGYTEIDISDSESESMGAYFFEGVKNNNYAYVVFIDDTAPLIIKSTFSAQAKAWCGENYSISQSINMYTYIGNFDFSEDEEGGNDDPDPSIVSSVLQGYNLPSNFKLTWNVANMLNTLIRINEDYYWYIEGISANYLKRTNNGYVYYEKEYDDNFNLVWAQGVNKSVAQAHELIVGDYTDAYLSKKPLIGLTSVGTASIKVGENTILTNKYASMEISGMIAYYYYHPSYSIVVQNEVVSNDYEAVILLTEFNSQISSFAELNISLPQ